MSRRAREAKGRRAEWLAALWLGLKGYRLLARRVQASGGEIDLVMRRGDQLVFVEVKARATLDSGLAAQAHFSLLGALLIFTLLGAPLAAASALRISLD